MCSVRCRGCPYRYRLAREAAVAVVNTLTWKDTLAIVPFDSNVRPQYAFGSSIVA